MTELIKGQCAHCMNIPEPPKRRPMTPGLTARFPGHCAGCGWEFDAGEQIRSDGAGGWLAECCDGDNA
ncbi:hypothetical protein [Nonomuraea angiospora]|uniref:hypothetical protein n=1 Tax=Nonomuraea angiospora TaxID=46172 RepID=UPI0029BE447A|nr:hypothetical protein [Nonomuraea angiospora]MDX3111547.1 hypothetical protein [Nonomuraea angiospora]